MITLLILFLIIGALVDVGRYIIGRLRSKKVMFPWGAFILLGLCGLASLFNFFMSYSPSLSPTSQPTPRPAPTFTPRPVVNTVEYRNPLSDCYRWDEITTSMNGDEVCVYGTVVRHSENFDSFLTNFYFGTLEQFFLVSIDRWPSKEGKCISATGIVQLNTAKVPYLKIGGVLYQCEAWME